MRRLVVPLGERREPGELERAEGELGRACRDRPEAARRSCVGDQRLAGRRERCRTRVAPTLIVSPATGRCGREHDRVDEILDGEQLVAVRAVAEHGDPPALADPVEEDLEDAEPLRPDEGLRADDCHVEAAPPEASCDLLGLDLRAAVVADSVQRRVLVDRMDLGDSVDGGGRDDECAADPRFERGGEQVAVPSTLTERISRPEPRIGSAAAAWTRTSAPSTRRRAAAGSRMSPRISSSVALEIRVVERGEVERADGVAVGEHAPREMQAEEARTA